MSIKVMSVFGTRPEAIKMAPLAKMLARERDIESIVAVTAQHRQMLDQVLGIFGIVPDIDLDLMKAGQTLSSITTGVLEGMDRVYAEQKPGLVLVHGDTTTTMAAALSAFYNRIPIGHVEAGLRTFDKYSPYPEEMNRLITGRIAELHFCPTENNAGNLKNEGVKNGIHVTGNTVIDALMQMVDDKYRFKNRELDSLDLSGFKTIVMTAHRRENLGAPLKSIFEAVRELVISNEDVQVVYRCI
jgi:UDP-N-acetylglucosamine 2-epimerase (non-hydrolysing)